MEIVDIMTRRTINVVDLLETKWVGEKTGEIERTWLYYGT
jgi:hypothetical protein